MKQWKHSFVGNFNRVLLLILASGLFYSCSEELIPQKYDMRGAWIATVNNIDWPSKPGLTSNQQKDEFRALANNLNNNGINALFVQIRPSTDAFFPSDRELWSKYLTDELGSPPDPVYDPTNFMIETSHSMGMEFHAWLNPYRAIINVDSVTVPPHHITNIKPGWFLKYGNTLYFDPGIPEVREYLIDLIGEVCAKYDLDGIHFDDYFYPYKIAGEVFPDSASFAKFGRDFSDVENWRRYNVNKLVEGLYDRIKSVNSNIKFGISPFGVWRNASQDPMGSDTKAGQTNYDDLYADVLHWMNNGWMDYILPQIYWHIGFDLADYKTLVEWWDKYHFDRHVYVGQAIYRVGSNSAAEWKNPSELPSHLRLNDKFENIHGNVYFNAKSYVRNNLGVTDTLRQNYYKYPALTPPMPWIDDVVPEAPINIKLVNDLNSVYLSWEFVEDTEEDLYTLVYKAKGNSPPDIDNMSNLIAKLQYPNNSFRDKNSGTYTYVLTTIDRLGNESEPSKPITIKTNK